MQTEDGWICVTSNSDAQSHAFLRAIGHPELVDDPRFRSVGDRFRHAREWFALRADALKQATTAHWLTVLGAADVPAMVCHTLATLPGDEHLTAVNLLTADQHPQEGAVTTIHPSLLIDGARAPPGTPTEHVGWSTCAVLRQAGLSEETIATLLADGGAVDGCAAWTG